MVLSRQIGETAPLWFAMPGQCQSVSVVKGGIAPLTTVYTHELSIRSSLCPLMKEIMSTNHADRR